MTTSVPAPAFDDFDGFVSPEDEAREHEAFASGDARRCPVHPGEKTSSDDGMFDAPCPRCEAEVDADCAEEEAS